MITDGLLSYAVFFYRCGFMEWPGGATIGFFANGSNFENHPLTGKDNANDVACLNEPTTEWSNIVYQLADIRIITESTPSPTPPGLGKNTTWGLTMPYSKL